MDSTNMVELGAGLVLGGMLSRNIAGAFAGAMDEHSSIAAVTIPQTRAEIATLLDKLDVRLANGQVTEALYKTITAKWQARLEALDAARS